MNKISFILLISLLGMTSSAHAAQALLIKKFVNYTNVSKKIAYGFDSKRAVLRDEEKKQTVIWDLRHGKEIFRTNDEVRWISIDGKRLIADTEKTRQLWNVDQGKVIADIWDVPGELNQEPDWFSKDGKYYAGIGLDAVTKQDYLVLANSSTGKIIAQENVEVIAGNDGWNLIVNSPWILDDGRYGVFTSKYPKATDPHALTKVVDLFSGQVKCQFQASGWMMSGHLAIYSDSGNTFHIVDPATCRATTAEIAVGGDFSALTHDGSMYLSAIDDEHSEMLDTRSGQVKFHLVGGRFPDLSQNDRRAVTISRETEVDHYRIYDTRSGKLLFDEQGAFELGMTYRYAVTDSGANSVIRDIDDKSQVMVEGTDATFFAGDKYLMTVSGKDIELYRLLD
jgi:hypothetical protein